jgi:hypothetical protein
MERVVSKTLTQLRDWPESVIKLSRRTRSRAFLVRKRRMLPVTRVFGARKTDANTPPHPQSNVTWHTQQAVSLCTIFMIHGSLLQQKRTVPTILRHPIPHFAHSIFLVRISEQSAIISTVITTETERVYCAVRTASLNKTPMNLRLRILNYLTRTSLTGSLMSHCNYCKVGTESININPMTGKVRVYEVKGRVASP